MVRSQYSHEPLCPKRQGTSGNLLIKLGHNPSSLAYDKLDMRVFAPAVWIFNFKAIKCISVASKGSPSPVRMPLEGHLLHLLTLIQPRWGDCFWTVLWAFDGGCSPQRSRQFFRWTWSHRRGKSFHIMDPDRSRQPHKGQAVITNSWTQVSRH